MGEGMKTIFAACLRVFLTTFCVGTSMALAACIVAERRDSSAVVSQLSEDAYELPILDISPGGVISIPGSAGTTHELFRI